MACNSKDRLKKYMIAMIKVSVLYIHIKRTLITNETYIWQFISVERVEVGEKQRSETWPEQYIKFNNVPARR